MTSTKMHPDEIYIDVSLVGRLISGQFPQWAHLPLKFHESAGTGNVIYRLGNDLAVRLPRTPSSVSKVEKEQVWLPQLAPLLPLAIPVPVGRGLPTDEYPWAWSVFRWIEGMDATASHLSDRHDAASALGRFVAALQKSDPTGGPPSGEQNFYRGVPLGDLDEVARASLKSLHGMIDIPAAKAAWEAALHTPAWKGKPKWIHGDLHAGNLLVRDGRLNAVIDFGGLGVGDPACDMMVAWTYFSSDTRKVFRAELGVDDATWARGRGWALYLGLVALPYYQTSNPALAGIARRSISEVLTDS